MVDLILLCKILIKTMVVQYFRPLNTMVGQESGNRLGLITGVGRTEKISTPHAGADAADVARARPLFMLTAGLTGN